MAEINQDKKYSKVAVFIKRTGGKCWVEFDPNDPEAVVKSFESLTGSEVLMVRCKLSEGEIKAEWREAVAQEKTELSFAEWRKEQVE